MLIYVFINYNCVILFKNFVNFLKSFNVIGVMSGTSTDGLDIALCTFEYDNDFSFKIVKTNFIPYDINIKQKLFKAYRYSGVKLRELDNYFGEFISDKLNDTISNNDVKIDLIASHGHTIFHRPDLKFTLQIGNGEVIAKNTGIPVVYDFRSGDVALGGQGAPLVPMGDELLFGNYSACLNLGGFSNISFKNHNGQRVAYDICPVNIIINKYANKLNLEYDINGKFASEGQTIHGLLKELNSLEFYSLKPPKSLGREWVEKHIQNILDKYSHKNIKDIINTLTIHISQQISKNLNQLENVLVTGGGAYNKFLIENIKQRTDTKIVIPDSKIIDFKEAMVFAFLGLLRYLNMTNCFASVTGAKRDSCCGVLCMP